MKTHRASPSPVIAILLLTAGALLGCAGSVVVEEGDTTGGHAAATSASSGAGGAVGAGGSLAAGTGAGGGSACAHGWAHVIGGPSLQIARSVAVDPTGAVVVSAESDGVSTLDGAPLLGDSPGRFVLARIEASGAVAWARAFGSLDDEDQLLPVALDADGSVVVAGSYYGTFDLGGGLSATADTSAVFVAKISASGEPLWLRSFPSVNPVGTVGCLALALDAAGDVLFAGSMGGGSLDLGGSPISGDFYLAKLDPSGAPLWQHAYTGAMLELHTMAVSAEGAVVVGGSLFGEVDFGGGPLTTAGGFDVFVAELDAQGDHAWSERFGDADLQRLHALAIGPTGAILIGGTYFGSFDLGGAPLTASGGYGSFVAALDPSGKPVWSRSVGGDVFGVTSLAALPSGEILAAGRVGTAPALGCGPLEDTSPNGMYLATLDASGACLSQRSFGAGPAQYVEDLKAGASGHAAMAGYFQGAADFGGAPVQGKGNDGFVLEIAPPCSP
jgi:hypothetical protein